MVSDTHPLTGCFNSLHKWEIEFSYGKLDDPQIASVIVDAYGIEEALHAFSTNGHWISDLVVTSVVLVTP